MNSDSRPVPHLFRSFRHRNFRLYFAGQSVSLIGTWMQRTALSWLVYSMTHSAFFLGLATFAGQIPSFLLTVFGGILSDRYHRFRLLLITQVAEMIQATVLTLILIFGHYNIWVILGMILVIGIINAFDTPIRQSILIGLVGNDGDLSNAIALNSSMINFARLAGPAIAGALLIYFSPTICIGINALSFVGVIASVLIIMPNASPPKPQQKALHDLRDAIRYLKKHAALKTTIIMAALVSILVMPFYTLLPIFAKEIFHGDAGRFGALNSACGLGALLGTLYLARIKTKNEFFEVATRALLVFGIFLIFFSWTSHFTIALSMMLVTGFGMMTTITAMHTMVQMQVSDHVRGRVMSFYSMAFFGLQPIGSLFIGLIAEKWGVSLTVAIEGFIGLLIASVFINFYRQISR